MAIRLGRIARTWSQDYSNYTESWGDKIPIKRAKFNILGFCINCKFRYFRKYGHGFIRFLTHVSNSKKMDKMS